MMLSEIGLILLLYVHRFELYPFRRRLSRLSGNLFNIKNPPRRESGYPLALAELQKNLLGLPESFLGTVTEHTQETTIVGVGAAVGLS